MRADPNGQGTVQSDSGQNVDKEHEIPSKNVDNSIKSDVPSLVDIKTVDTENCNDADGVTGSAIGGVSDANVDDCTEFVSAESDLELSDIEAEIVRRDVPKYDGVYIFGSLCNTEVTFTVDTGASSSVVSRRAYEQIPEDKRPRLWRKGKTSLSNAEGGTMKYLGCASFDVSMGPLRLRKLLIVGECQDEVLLGADILQRDPSGPADIMLSENRMILRGEIIPLEQIGVPRVMRKVRAADHFIIQGMSEQVIDVLVDRPENDASSRGIVEASPDFTESHAVVVAPTLVDIADQVTVKVRVMNPFTEDVSIRQDTVIGHFEDVHSEPEVAIKGEEPAF